VNDYVDRKEGRKKQYKKERISVRMSKYLKDS
jgi:hypothetical protein